jgi:hypothetical protein
MSWNLFIDDERFPPNDGRDWVICRNMFQVENEIMIRDMPSFISFDHDLGENEPTGYDIAKWLVEIDMISVNELCRFPDNFAFYVHSQNPIGKANIESYLNNYMKCRSQA